MEAVLVTRNNGEIGANTLVREQAIEPLDKLGRVYRILEPELLRVG